MRMRHPRVFNVNGKEYPFGEYADQHLACVIRNYYGHVIRMNSVQLKACEDSTGGSDQPRPTHVLRSRLLDIPFRICKTHPLQDQNKAPADCSYWDTQRTQSVQCHRRIQCTLPALAGSQGRNNASHRTKESCTPGEISSNS